MSGHLPDRVWIGGKRHSVKADTTYPRQGTFEILNDDLKGRRFTDGGTIYVSPVRNKDIIEQHETLFHEILHAAEIATGRHIGEVSVEKIGKVLFRGLLSSGLYNLAPDTSQLELPMWEDI
jgi:hypothetical protein